LIIKKKFDRLITICIRYREKHYRRPNRQSRIDNPEKLKTLDTQDTGEKQTKHKNTTHCGKLKI
jgi:hypothetical protein